MANSPTSDTEADDDTPQAKAKAAARKAARAAAIAETYTAGGGITPADPVGDVSPRVVDDLKMRELVDAAVEAGDLKKPAAKAAIESALKVLGAALADGRDVNLPGLGKVKIKRSKVTNGRRVLELRLRQNADDHILKGPGTDGVAEDDEGR